MVVELRTVSPLIRVDIFAHRPFLVDIVVLALAMVVFVPQFLFVSQYAQVSLGRSPAQTWIVLVYFFVGFVIAAQAGGRILDRVGVKETVVLGCTAAAAGFALWAGEMSECELESQRWFIVLAGAGMGLVLGPVNADAFSHAAQVSYGEVVGITQTIRNFAGSLGLAILGTILLSLHTERLTASLMDGGMPLSQAQERALLIAHHAKLPPLEWDRPAHSPRQRISSAMTSPSPPGMSST